METVKLYSPVKLYQWNSEIHKSRLYDNDYTQGVPVHKHAIVYIDAINAAADEINATYGERGFMADYTPNELKNKVHSVIPHFEAHGNKLWCVAQAESDEPLTPEEVDELKTLWLNLLINEWGMEMTEPITVGDDKIYVETYMEDPSFFIIPQTEFEKRLLSQNHITQEQSDLETIAISETLISPVNFYLRDNDMLDAYDDTYYYRDELSHDEAYEYLEEIEQAVRQSCDKEGDRGLMEYFSGSESVNRKVYSLLPHIELLQDKLYCTAHLKLTEPLTPDERAELKEYWLGQLSDGWGEAFDDREIEVDRGKLYLQLWTPDNSFFIKTLDEFSGRQGYSPIVGNENQPPSPKQIEDVAKKIQKLNPDADVNKIIKEVQALVDIKHDNETQKLEHLHQQLCNRIDGNLNSYLTMLRDNADPDKILSMTKDIAAILDAHWYLKEYEHWTVPDLEFILQFQSPLEVFASRLPGTLSGTVDLEGVLATAGGILDEKKRNELLHQFALVSDSTSPSLTEKVEILKERLAGNYKEYTEFVLSCEKAEIMRLASDVACITQAYEYFTHTHGFKETEVDFLLQFKIPLDVINAKWQVFWEDMSVTQEEINSIFSDQENALDRFVLLDNGAATPEKSRTSEIAAESKSVLAKIRQGQSGQHHRPDLPPSTRPKSTELER